MNARASVWIVVKKPKLIEIKSKHIELVIIKIYISPHPLLDLTDMTAREVISYVL